MRTLPLLEELVFRGAECKVRRDVVLQALSYGTDYDVHPKEISTLAERSEETAALLVQAWTEEVENTNKKSNNDDELETLLVDSLWLVNSISPPQPSNEDDNDAASSASYQALVGIVTALAAVPHRNAFLVRLQGTLDPALLEASRVLPKGGKDALVKRLRKFNTDLYYRQQKFNLLQEESEGYAKLLTLLTTTSSPLSSTNQLSKRISECMAAFELDPNRVLDLILDVLEARIAESSSAKIDHRAENGKNNDNGVSILLHLMKKFSLKKIPHLLGFKFASYHSSSQEVPNSLYTTTVLLAKEGILEQLHALSPHLPPTSEIKDAYKIVTLCERQRVLALGRIRLNTSDGPDPKETERNRKIQDALNRLSSNALLGLVNVLLREGDWEQAQTLLPTNELWSQVCTLLPVLGQSICDHVVSDRIQPLYEALVEPPSLVNEEGTSITGILPQTTSSTAIKPLSVTLGLDGVVRAISQPIFAIIDSGCIDTRPVLYGKICRLIRALLDKEKRENNNLHLSSDTYQFLQTFVVPSLSVFAPNPALSAELWSVLKILPYATRYRLYRDWRGVGLEKEGLRPSSRKPLVQARCEMEAGKAARYALKRLSKENVRDMGRQVSKVTHSNPLVVFATILSQIESYDNLIEMMVETVRFVTPLSLDVLGFCVLSRLSGSSDKSSTGSNSHNNNRSRLKGDGVNVSQWLASLESFTGAFYKKCPEVELRGIFCFLIDRLKDGHVSELGVLRTLITTAGGYGFADFTSSSSLSKEQLIGRTGSQLLKRETFAFGVVEQINQISSQRVRSVLQSDGMGVAMLILLTQVRSRILFLQKGMRPQPIKLLGNLFDTCQCILGLLLEFLTIPTEGDQDNMRAIAKFADFMPTVVELHEKYKMEPALAWMLCRPLVRSAMVLYNEENKEKASEEQQKLLKPYLPSEISARQTCNAMLPKIVWSQITPELFQFFFANAIYDIRCPVGSYEAEISRLKEKVARLTQLQKGGASAAGAKAVLAAAAASAGATQQEINRATLFSRADVEELQRVIDNTATLSSDLSKHKKHCELIRKRTNATKEKLFPSNKVSVAMVQTFLTHCVYPRCSLSPNDAIYCAWFVSLLHEMETPGFSTLHYADALIDAITGTLFCVTEGEAANIAVLLWETWQMVTRWRYDEKIYNEEVAGKPGSFMERITTDGSKKGKEIVAVSYAEYKILYSKWHTTIGEAALGCLKSSEYIQTRACLVVLTRIVDTFPTRPVLGEKLISALSPLQEDSYPLKDITAMAQSYSFLISKARNDGVWKEEDAAAVTARIEKEKAVLDERKKAAQKRFDEMKEESEQITAQVGDFVGRDRGRDQRRDGGRDERGRAPSRGETGDSRLRSPPLSAAVPKFKPPVGKSMPSGSRVAVSNGDIPKDNNRRGEEPRRGDRDRENRDRERPQGSSERRQEGGQSGAHVDSRRRGQRGVGGRDGTTSNKRGRSPGKDVGPSDTGNRSIGVRETDREDIPSKRQRVDRGGRDGGDRDGRSRPNSPNRGSLPRPQNGDRGGGGRGNRSDRRR